MAKVGDVIENLVSGQRLIFRKTIEDTGGKLLEVDSLYTKPTPSRPPTHHPPHQQERPQVPSRAARTLIDGQERTLKEGRKMRSTSPRRRKAE